MLVKILKLLILTLFAKDLFCMNTNSEIKNRHIKTTLNERNEVIYKIERSVHEKWKDLFSEAKYVLKKGGFSEVKLLIKTYCKSFIENIYHHRKESSLENLKKVLSIFERKSKFLLDDFSSNQLLVQLACEDTVELTAKFFATSLGVQGIILGESGYILLAFAIAIAVCFNPILFFSMCTIISYAFIDNYLENNIEALVLFWVTLSFLFIKCLKKMNHIKNERNIELEEIKKIIIEFQKFLAEKIASYDEINLRNVAMKLNKELNY